MVVLAIVVVVLMVVVLVLVLMVVMLDMVVLSVVVMILFCDFVSGCSRINFGDAFIGVGIIGVHVCSCGFGVRTCDRGSSACGCRGDICDSGSVGCRCCNSVSGDGVGDRHHFSCPACQ